MIDKPEEVMQRFKFLPTADDVDAAAWAYDRLCSREGYQKTTRSFVVDSRVEPFGGRKKNRALLDLLGTDDIELAKKRLRKLLRYKRGEAI